jgi:signal transduction histidine kinase
VRLRQVLVNIIRNGCEASGEELPKIAVHIYKPGNNYKIEIHNSGKQIDNETMQKIFQPFFTTKAKGSGLGLAICKKIMEAHKGSILIGKSGKEGYATCVTVEWVPKEQIYGQNIDS